MSLTLLASGPEQPFLLRTDAPPSEWKVDQINEGVGFGKGVVHVLAWEVIEERTSDGRRSEVKQVLVLKRFDQPTKTGKSWVLARVRYHPDDKAWRTSTLHSMPVAPGETIDQMTDAMRLGWELYKDVPNDIEIETFLRDSRWTPKLGAGKVIVLDKKVLTLTTTTKLTSGGIDREIWKRLFERDVPATLFPELKKATEEKK